MHSVRVSIVVPTVVLGEKSWFHRSSLLATSHGPCWHPMPVDRAGFTTVELNELLASIMLSMEGLMGFDFRQA